MTQPDQATAPADTRGADPTEVEHRVSRKHSLRIGERELPYEASAGTVRVRRDDHTPLADMFYLAYRATPATASAATAPVPARPLTFLFNGGPGSASLWLNVGGFGPRRAPTTAPAPAPPAPYEFGDNPHTLLAHSDLVFIDAVGTGYSRLVGDGRSAEVWGVDQDVDAFARAIMRYLTISGSWGAPRYLFGESYGTTRAAALVHRLQNLGLDFNGVVLLSTILDFAAIQPGADQGYVNLLPTLAATASYHGRGGGRTDSLEELLAEVRDFAQGDYARVLQLGDRVDQAEERAVGARLAGYIGIDLERLLRVRLRVDLEDFRRDLLRDEGRLIGRFDTRFVTDDHFAAGGGSVDPATDDPATAGVNSIHLAALHRHLREDIGFSTELHYRPLHNMVVETAWDYHHKAPGIDGPTQLPNVALDLAAAMRRNVNLRVCVMGGIYDLATPFLGAEYDISHMYLSERLRGNVRCHWYESGHMTFVDEDVVARMAGDLAAFYAGAPV